MNYIQILYLCILKQRVVSALTKKSSCELHSNLVSLHSETTEKFESGGIVGLWITFKSCIFAFWNNVRIFNLIGSRVVNYIQTLYLCILKQRNIIKHSQAISCELHSNLVSLHSETTSLRRCRQNQGLWITFKSCIFAFWNNWESTKIIPFIVVNYIQILYLCILKQRKQPNNNKNHCCELHSNLVSLHSETTGTLWATLPGLLWITFKSCIFAFWNNKLNLTKETIAVVNYIQILYLCILKQRCFCYAPPLQVVNYIQILYLCILKQQREFIRLRKEGCELHSNLVSLHSETTYRRCF